MPPRKRKQPIPTTDPPPAIKPPSHTPTPIPTPNPPPSWPPYFHALSRTHKALNIVYTFFTSTRRHVPTTLEALGPAVEARLGRRFGRREVGEIKTVAGGWVGVGWVDLRGWEEEEGGAGGSGGSGGSDSGRGGGGGVKEEPQMAVLFEYLDGLDVNPGWRGAAGGNSTSAAAKKPKSTKARKTKPPPPPTQAQMLRTITARNEHFNLCIGMFLEECVRVLGACATDEEKVVAYLERMGREALPESYPGYHHKLDSPTTPTTPTITIKSELDLGLQEITRTQEINIHIPPTRTPIPEILESLTTTAPYFTPSQIVSRRILPARTACYEPGLTFPLSQKVVNALWGKYSVTPDGLFSHQKMAGNVVVGSGRDVVVVTGTGSGKSLCFLLPVVCGLEREGREMGREGGKPSGRAIFVFPTKALAQDQLRGVREFVAGLREEGDDDDGGRVRGESGSGGEEEEEIDEWRVDTYDGDTELEDRRRVREEARIVLTNPDMLHVSIIPAGGVRAGEGGGGMGGGGGGDGGWRRFLKELRFVVVDELHVYHGSFGIHMAYIMRRLRRVCAALGNEDIRFIGCSATISNPVQHMQTLFNLATPPALIDQDGSPCGEKHLISWQPPLLPQPPQHQQNPIRLPDDPPPPPPPRLPAITEASRLVTQLLLRGTRTIAFTRTRKSCELLHVLIQSELTRLRVLPPPDSPPDTTLVMSYRGGYSPQERRKIERDLKEGRIWCVVSTSALELGVDIGFLDAVVMVGLPWSAAQGGVRQQSGRAGRRGMDSLAVYVGAEEEGCDWDAGGELVLDVEAGGGREVKEQVVCAAGEMGLCLSVDGRWFGENVLRGVCEGAGDGDGGRTEGEGWVVRGGVAPRIHHHSSDGGEDWGELGKYLYIPHPRFLPHPPRHINIRSGPSSPSDSAPTAETYPSSTSTANPITIIDTTPPHPPRVLEASLPPLRAILEAHPGAIYLHMGTAYLVHSVSQEKGIATVVRQMGSGMMLSSRGRGGGGNKGRVEYLTNPRDHTDVRPGDVFGVRDVVVSSGGDDGTTNSTTITTTAKVSLGKVELTTTVFGYMKVDLSGRVLDIVDGSDIGGWSGKVPTVRRWGGGVWVDLLQPCTFTCPPSSLPTTTTTTLLTLIQSLLTHHNNNNNLLKPTGKTSTKITLASALHSAEHALLAALTHYPTGGGGWGGVKTPCTATPASGASGRVLFYDTTPPPPPTGEATSTTSSQLLELWRGFGGVARRALSGIEGCPCVEKVRGDGDGDGDGVGDVGCVRCLGVGREKGGRYQI
ncbi:hypothetical protein DFH27DRAFT_604000 [Peziza echinospora]|nr:hypothetical protein DFH27DRAFT_604000 [Peziza echinospora]